jgi:transcriptional regulator with XRE-family HTH domain
VIFDVVIEPGDSLSLMSDRPRPTDPAHDIDSQLSEAIGTRVRSYRLQLGFTIAQLAEHSGLSKGMLSKIENAQASPSLSTLARISNALDVPLTAFFDSIHAHTVSHVKAGRGLDLVPRGSRSGLRSQLLGNLRGTQRRLEPILYTLNRRSKVSESFRHPGTEFLYLIEGVMEYGYGAQRFILERGDSLQFDGEVTHGPVRLIEIPVKLLSVKAYGTGTGSTEH